jgi:predicted transposase YbfD/YdcC
MSAALDTAATTTPATASKIALLDHFARLDDPRQSAKVVFPLPEIMLLVLSATIAGCDDLVEVCEWGRERLDFLRRYLLFRDDIPSHDTLTDVVNALDPEVFKSCFMDWVACLRDSDPDIIAVDGKTSRRTHDKAKDRKPLHLVSAWASRQRLVLGQQATEEKSNEITAIPLLLERLHLKGAIVTIDAMGCQTAIAEKIIEKGGDYCLSLKDNRPLLLAEVEKFFDDPQATGIATTSVETTDKDHGRLEIRKHTVCHDIDWLFSDRRYPGELKFPGLAMIGVVESSFERNGQVEPARRFYLCSKKLSAKAFAEVVRAHWGVENRLHWTLDVIFDEDQCRLRTGHGPENMAIVRHMALNMLQAPKSKTSLKVRRKKAGWNANYLGEILRGAG